MATKEAEFIKLGLILRQLDIRPGMKVGDLGCGSGYLAVPIAKIVGGGGRVYGVDVQKAVLEHLRQAARLENLDNIEAVWSDLEIPGATGIAASSLDMVLLVNMLFQVEKKEDVFRESKRLLKPGGALLVVDWNPDANEGFGPAQESRMRKEDAQALARSAGFSEEKQLSAGAYHFGILFRKPE